MQGQLLLKAKLQPLAWEDPRVTGLKGVPLSLLHVSKTHYWNQSVSLGFCFSSGLSLLKYSYCLLGKDPKPLQSLITQHITRGPLVTQAKPQGMGEEDRHLNSVKDKVGSMVLAIVGKITVL